MRIRIIHTICMHYTDSHFESTQQNTVRKRNLRRRQRRRRQRWREPVATRKWRDEQWGLDGVANGRKMKKKETTTRRVRCRERKRETTFKILSEEQFHHFT